MPENVKWRGLFVLFCVVLSLIVLAPTLLRESTPGLISKAFDPIHLGLDLQGGMHLVLGVEVEKAVESRLDTLIDETELSLTEKDIVFKRVERRQGDRITVIVYDAAAGAEVCRQGQPVGALRGDAAGLVAGVFDRLFLGHAAGDDALRAGGLRGFEAHRELHPAAGRHGEHGWNGAL